jgi:hypothetical protein
VYQLRRLALLVAVAQQIPAGEQLYLGVYSRVAVVLVEQVQVLASQEQTGARVAVPQMVL